MIYRVLGRTGLKVSQLGFGAMRLPMTGEGKDARVCDELAVPLIRRAFELGVNYIDTAVMYCNNDGERALGVALKGWRDRIILSTKNPANTVATEKEWWTHLETSLKRLDVDYIDIYNHHGINGSTYDEHIAPRIGKWMLKAREQGLVKHICCSFHGSNADLVKIVDTGYVAVITLQYNVLDRSLEEGIAHARAKGVAIVVMGPVGGGRLAEPSEVLAEMVPGCKHVPELALRFVLANPGVTVALSGMSDLKQLEENVRVASDPSRLSAEELAGIDGALQRLKKMADLYCTDCKYCMPCPAEVKIPGVFHYHNMGRVYGLWNQARIGYARIGTVPWEPGKTAEACTGCGACETKCPQKLPIREQLKKAHAALTKQ